MEYEYKNTADLLALFKSRNMQGIDKSNEKIYKKNINTIQTIGYYKLKQYGYPFYNKETSTYSSISFKQLVDRYYRDQALKQEIFQVITDIETAVNNQIVNILGKNGPYDYLSFGKWCQKNSKNKFLKKKKMDKYSVKKEELDFLSKLQYKIKKSNFEDLIKFKTDNSGNFFPPVWLMINTLTLGESIHIIKLMSRRRRETIASFFNLDVNTFIDWIDLLNLIRNICCHNGDLVDIKLKTNPSVPKKYRKYLNISSIDGKSLPHNLSMVICVLLELMKCINPKHKIYNIFYRLHKLCSMGNYDKNKLAQNMGFKDYYSMKRMIFSFYEYQTVTFFPDGNIYVMNKKNNSHL